ncbi:MAG: YdcF family protein [Pseudomonas sp.]|nr:YdcF family protein [Pseudomonas sp.]
MNRSIILAITLLLAQPGHSAPVRDQHWSLIAHRLFPALVDLGTVQANARSGSLSTLLANRRTRMDACRLAPGCLLKAGIWTDAEIDGIATAAAKVPASPWRKSALADDGIKAQVSRELRGLNSVIQVYGFGSAPRYPLVDGPIDPPGSPQWNIAVADAVLLAEAGKDDPVLSLDPGLALAIALLDVNDRADAAAFEPLDKVYNAAAFSRARTIDWKRYRYTAIIVPGIGPENPSLALSARGKLNVRMAASRFADGEAPFVMLSGAAVHPKESGFVEAVEMRKALIERFGVPADRIIIEPYARHTTTNLRNVSRRLIAMGAPLAQDTLVITNIDQSRYIESSEFAARNQADLGYVPGTIGPRLSPHALIFRPSAKSLRVDPGDPLDP